MMWHAHDLLWLSRRAELIPVGNSDKLPDWVANGSGPVVVRRAHSLNNHVTELVPVGVRGRCKAERCAAYVPASCITKSISPFDLMQTKPWMNHPLRDKHPVLKTLTHLLPLLDSLRRPWGVTGSCGYELATETSQLGPASDLDLIIDGAQFWSKDDSAQWLSQITQINCRLDIQLETPTGAIALNEWAAGRHQVMVKGNQGPFLTTNPWDLIKECA